MDDRMGSHFVTSESLSSILGTSDVELEYNFQRTVSPSSTHVEEKDCLDEQLEASLLPLWDSARISAPSAGGSFSLPRSSYENSGLHLTSAAERFVSPGDFHCGGGPWTPGTPGNWRSLATPPVPPEDIGEKFGRKILQKVGHNVGFRGAHRPFIPEANYPEDVRPTFVRRRRQDQASKYANMFQQAKQKRGKKKKKQSKSLAHQTLPSSAPVGVGDVSPTSNLVSPSTSTSNMGVDTVTSSVSMRLTAQRMKKKSTIKW